MKKFSIILSIFLFLSLSMNNLTVMAQPINLQLSEGIYSMKDLKLMENTTYNVQNNSAGTIVIFISDGDQQLMEYHRLKANSVKYNIGPFRSVDKLVLLGPGTITLTQ